MMSAVGDVNEKQEYFVTKILSGVAQMTALVENVQDAGRYDPDSGSYQVMRVPTDVSHIVHKIVENHLVPAEKSLTVSLSVAEDLPIINADETMLQRAISNLVDNAIKYTPDGGSIHISVTRPDSKIIVAIEDTGLGISPQNQAQLFERHSRIHRPEFKKIKGTGLGLFIVRSVAKRHGGDAWVKSEEGHGSIFYISIPLEGANLLSSAD
jgi:signal transduction histidine kinase